MADLKSKAGVAADIQLVIFSRDARIIHASAVTHDLIRRQIKLKICPTGTGGSGCVSDGTGSGTVQYTIRQIIKQLCDVHPRQSKPPVQIWHASWKARGQMHSGVCMALAPSRTDSGVLIITPPGALCDETPSKLELQAIVDTAVDGIITIDARGIIESFNPAAEKLFRCRKAAVIGKPVTVLMPEPFKTEHDGYMHRYLRTGEKRIIGIGREVMGLRSDGTTFPMFLSVGEHHVAGRSKFTGIIHDITDRKRAEAQVLLVSDRVHQRLGHELHDGIGQVLTGAALYARAIETQCTERHPEMVDKLHHLVGLITDAATQTRQLSRGLQPLPHKSDYVVALDSLRLQLNGLLAVDLDVQADELPREAHLLHANNLLRIAQEAVANALRHSSAKHIAIQSQSFGRSVRLSIKDDGKGFARRSRNGHGLHIMEYRARMMGGQLRVESRPRQGTAIICTVDCGIITKEMGELKS